MKLNNVYVPGKDGCNVTVKFAMNGDEKIHTNRFGRMSAVKSMKLRDEMLALRKRGYINCATATDEWIAIRNKWAKRAARALEEIPMPAIAESKKIARTADYSLPSSMKIKPNDIIALSKASEAIAKAVRSEVCRRHGKHIRIDDSDADFGWEVNDLIATAYVEAGKVEPLAKLECAMHGMYTANNPEANKEWLREHFTPTTIGDLNELAQTLAKAVENAISWDEI